MVNKNRQQLHCWFSDILKHQTLHNGPIAYRMYRWPVDYTPCHAVIMWINSVPNGNQLRWPMISCVRWLIVQFPRSTPASHQSGFVPLSTTKRDPSSAIWPYHDNDVTVMPCCLAIQCFTDNQWNRCLVCYLKTNLLLIIRHAVIRIVSRIVV